MCVCRSQETPALGNCRGGRIVQTQVESLSCIAITRETQGSMATQHETSITTAPASLVGNAFVNRYYKILHQTPHLGHRFYTEESQISRAEPTTVIAVESATSLSGIHEKITSLDYHAMRTEIMTVDTQQSLAGQVLVMVTGALYNVGGVRRTFVQTFVLVPQEKSYFIHNDMFRFLDSEAKSHQKLFSQVNSNIPVPHEKPLRVALDQGITEAASLSQPERADMTASSDIFTADKHFSIREQNSVPATKDCGELSLQAHDSDVLEGTLAEGPMAKTMMQSQSEGHASKSNELTDLLVESNEATLKKSYASILRLQKESPKIITLTVSAPSITKVSTTHAERSVPSSALQAVQSAVQSPLTGGSQSPDHTEDITISEAEGDGRSVYLKSLPLNVTVSELEEVLRKFGPLKPGGINLRNQRIGICYAFVEFEEASSAQLATEASPINMSGRQVYIEEKRIFPSRGGRGRPSQGRPYQNDGLRGRSVYGNGGRGSNRAPIESEKDSGTGRGSSVTVSRGGYGGGNFHMPNSFRRPDLQNGITFRPIRQPGNQMGKNGPLVRSGIMVVAA